MSTAPPAPRPGPPTVLSTRQNPQPTTSPRNLVLCFDGTSNTFSSHHTNIPVLYSLLSADPTKQMIYYQSGIGTYHPPFTPSGIIGRLSQIVDSAIAWNLGEHIRDGYQFLMQTYQPGDRICLFGFSRGAFTARALAGMIQQVGILLPGNEQSINLAYSIYAGKDQWLVDGKELLTDAFKRTFSRDAHIHFIGCWDTVASVGALIPRTLPFASGGHSISTFRHALSLDERRARFPPQYWTTPDPPPRIRVTPPTTPETSSHPLPAHSHDWGATSVQEVFFPGSHSDVGGGASATDGDVLPRLSHLSLRWMLREMLAHGIELDVAAVVASPIYAPFLAETDRRTAPAEDDGEEHRHHPAFDPAVPLGIPQRDQLTNTRAERRYMYFLIEAGGETGPRTQLDARANRSDALSFSIGVKKEGWLRWMMVLTGRAKQRAKTAAWWALELLPGLRIEWDVDGQTKSWRFMSHLGRGRPLPAPVTYHTSVMLRRNTPAGAFALPNGSGVVERVPYTPAAVLAKGYSIKEILYVE